MLAEERLKKELPLTETAFLVLLAMYHGNHGYGVLQKVEEITQGRVLFGPGTLYGAINNLSKKGWIKLIKDDKTNRRKDYETTDVGKQLVLLELERMKQLVEEGAQFIGKEGK